MLENPNIAEALRILIEKYLKTPRHSNGSILGSMTTYPHRLAIYSYLLFIHTNSSDPVIFKEIGVMEGELIRDLNRFYGNKCSMQCGLTTSGGTESNILALLTALKSKSSGDRVVLAPDTIHVSVDKACDILGCRLVKIPTQNLPVDPSILEDYVKKYKPFAIIVTAGTTERGLIDPIKEVGELAEQYNIYLHVDAAYGGLIIPFLYKHGLLNDDVRFYTGVSSISIDFHKNGLTPIPSGILLFSDEKYVDTICYPAKYTLHGEYCGLLGTRPGASIAAMWSMWRFLGIDYYEKLALKMFNLSRYTYRRLLELNDLLVYEPILPIIVFRHRKIPYNILLEKLLNKGYYLYKAPSLRGLRIVIMPHVEKRHIDKFIQTLETIL